MSGKVILITGTDEKLDRELGNVRPELVIREEKPRGSNGAIATMKKARDLSISMDCPVIVALYPPGADQAFFDDRDFPGSSIYRYEADIAIKMGDRKYEISKSRTIFIDHLMGDQCVLAKDLAGAGF